MKQRLINANKLRQDFLDLPNCYNGFSDTYDKSIIIETVDEQPTVKAIPIEWLKNKVKEALDEHRIDDALYLQECLAEWEEGNEISRLG